jgi:hypothetical protein
MALACRGKGWARSASLRDLRQLPVHRQTLPWDYFTFAVDFGVASHIQSSSLSFGLI